jgi:transposase
VFWKPIWNILDAGDFVLLLVNPRDIKQVPGRKSDVRDCQWIAQLLQCGLLKSSFVPDRQQRELRDLTRQRAQLEGEHTRAVNRIHKVLEDANIKLAAVASDIMGKSGRAMLSALLAGQTDVEVLADMALGRMRKKLDQLRLALDGHLTEHHRFVLRSLLDHADYLDRQITSYDQRIAELFRPFVPPEKVAALDAIPGVNRKTIENVLAEIGADMKPFPSDGHLSSWAGMCPGNEESAGKRRRTRTTKGNVWLRRALAEAAWAASRTKDSYLGAQYRRLAARRGKKRALIAVGHTLLRLFYHLLTHDVEYQDLGADFFERHKPERLRRYLVKRLEKLGYQVQLSEIEQAA